MNKALLLAVLSITTVPYLRADEGAFKPAITIKVVVLSIEHTHLAKPVVNDQVSRKWFDALFDTIDPRRIYFLRSDLETLSKYRDSLDDLAKSGDYQFATSVLKLYRSRLKQSNTITREFLGRDFNFTVDETCQNQFTDYAESAESLRERLRLLLKLELLSERVHGRTISNTKMRVEGRLKRLTLGAETMSDERWCQIYVNALASCIDPHTAYISPTTLRSFSSHMRFRSYSLGLKLGRRNGHLQLMSLPNGWSNVHSLTRILAWDIVGFRQLDGTYHDLVELHDGDLRPYFAWRGPLGDDSQVDLELRNPKTWERITLRVPRYRSL